MNRSAMKLRAAIAVAAGILIVIPVSLFQLSTTSTPLDSLHALNVLPQETDFDSELRQSLLAAATARKVLIAAEYLQHPGIVYQFYEQRNYEPVWSPDRFLELTDILHAANYEGLRDTYYHVPAIEQAISAVDEEILCTDAVFSFAHDLAFGKSSSDVKGSEWVKEHEDDSLIALVERALRSQNLNESLLVLAPQRYEYRVLRDALSQYRDLKTVRWQQIPAERTFKKGIRDEAILILRKRLILTGDLMDANSLSPEFDDALEAAVKHFQARHGLRADGIAGRSTVDELNVPIADRIRQIEVNMERLRWLPRALPERLVLVNVAAFELQMMEQGMTVESMRVIAGRRTWPTATFLSSDMTEIVLNPYWYIPHDIVQKEILPSIDEDPEYLAKNRIRVIRTDEGYRLRQDKGEGNSLGRIKFLFPNGRGIYLHDTPERKLFRTDLRAYSHGCIRIEKALDFAAWLMFDQNGWNAETIEAAIQSGQIQTIDIAMSVPIYIVYLTAWGDEKGEIQFRKDIYGNDQELLQELAVTYDSDDQ